MPEVGAEGLQGRTSSSAFTLVHWSNGSSDSFSSKVLVVPSRLPQVEPSRWLVDVRARTLAVLPLSTAGGAVRKAAEGALDMRSILVEGDLIAVSA